MIKRFVIMLSLVLLLFAALAFVKYKQFQAGMAMKAMFAPPPATVTTLVAKPQTWEPVLSAIGAMKAVNGVTVSTDLAGVVSEIHFESGAAAKKGDLLLKLDTRQEDAQLAQAEAKLDLSKISLARQQDLLGKKAIAQSDYDSAASDFRQNQAAVENAKALIARKTITAPFDGSLGIRLVNLGQYLNVGDPIVPLQSLNPIYVDFSIPQQQIEQIAVGKKIRIKVSGVEDKEFDGQITSINSLVDPATRNVTVEATAQNDDGKLRPGMFVKVEVILPPQEGVITIPSSAINYSPYGDSVFIVNGEAKDDDGKPVLDKDGKPVKQVDEQFVKLGPTRGDQVSIISGMKAGDEVVTSGVFKLRPHAAVFIDNKKVQPGNDPNPTPPDT
jgi:membrane fusion protein (multidrug efflux system)